MVLGYGYRRHLRSLFTRGEWQGPRSVERVQARYEADVRSRLGADLDRARVDWPPKRMTLLGFKKEKVVELWLGGGGGERFVKRYPVLAASGGSGPKTRRGDEQVPEGIYGLPALNPNSSFHLSIRVDYPSSADRVDLGSDVDMGGDIFVHGSDVSIGCLAMGDTAIEELFIVASRVPAEQRRILIAPHDFRQNPASPPKESRRWVLDRYRQLRAELTHYRH